MPGDTSIQWTDKSWNPATGCDKVSPGCAHCYAEVFAERWRGTPGHPYEQGFDLKLWPERLDAPLRWRKPSRIFVNSMSDLFHEDIPDEFIAAVFGVIATAAQHTFQVLTKRPDRMREWFRWYATSCRENDLCFPAEQAMFGVECAREMDIDGLELLGAAPDAWPIPNVWLGVSIENRRFVGRADVLRETPAAVRFISAEPLLGPLVYDTHGQVAGEHEASRRRVPCFTGGGDPLAPQLDLTRIDWLIVGGESGPGHRPMRLEWARDLVAAARAAGCAPFVKQLGGARPGTALEDLPEDLRVREFPTARTHEEATA